MATTVVHTIKASGGDYTSLSAWEAAQQRNLVTGDEIAVAECYPFIDTIAVTVSGWTTGINNYVIIRAHSSAKATVPITTDGSRYLLRVSRSGIGVLEIRQNHTQVIDIQMQNILATANSSGIDVIASNNTFRNCVVTAAAAEAWFFQGGSSTLQNCVGYRIGGVGSTSEAAFYHDNSSVRYDNCLAFVNGLRAGWKVNSVTVNGIIFRNCIAIVSPTSIGSLIITGTGIGISSIDVSKCVGNISTDNKFSVINGITNQPVIFANSSIADYHLDWMDPVAQKSGVDLSASDTGSFSDDFDGNTRTAPWYAGPLRVSNSPNGIQLGTIGNSNIQLSSTGTSPITIR